MTEPEDTAEHPAPAERRVDRRRRARQAAMLSWAEWLERGATESARPLRPFFEAELAFEAWAGPLWRSTLARVALAARGGRRAVRAATRACLAATRRIAAAVVRRTTEAAGRLDATDTLRLGQTLVAVTMILAILAVGALEAIRPSARSILVDRVASGRFADTEAMGPPAPAQAEDRLPTADAVAAASSTPADVVAPPAPPAIPARRGALPVGKGMWIWIHDRAEGGDADAIVARAKAVGLTHIYVRTATLRDGFMAAGFLNVLLPKAHAAGIRVFAWDFPYLRDVDADVQRAVAAITYLTPDGHRVDGYAADIELRSMGVNVNPQTAAAFGAALRRAVGPGYPLIACVPRPNPALVTYPFAEVVGSFDAVAPMVYWLGRNPAADVTAAIAALAAYGKPVLPVGQAYDGSAEGGPAGVPPRDEMLAFMQAAEAAGATGVSWWSWQHADQQAWDAVRDAPQFTLPVAPAPLTPGQIRLYQLLLSSLGFPAPVSGAWDGLTEEAVRAYQTEARLPVTGVIDAATLQILLSPFPPPIAPQP